MLVGQKNFKSKSLTLMIASAALCLLSACGQPNKDSSEVSDDRIPPVATQREATLTRSIGVLVGSPSDQAPALGTGFIHAVRSRYAVAMTTRRLWNEACEGKRCWFRVPKSQAQRGFDYFEVGDSPEGMGGDSKVALFALRNGGDAYSLPLEPLEVTHSTPEEGALLRTLGAESSTGRLRGSLGTLTRVHLNYDIDWTSDLPEFQEGAPILASVQKRWVVVGIQSRSASKILRLPHLGDRGRPTPIQPSKFEQRDPRKITVKREILRDGSFRWEVQLPPGVAEQALKISVESETAQFDFSMGDPALAAILKLFQSEEDFTETSPYIRIDLGDDLTYAEVTFGLVVIF